jgi:hypothetical protein
MGIAMSLITGKLFLLLGLGVLMLWVAPGEEDPHRRRPAHPVGYGKALTIGYF